MSHEPEFDEPVWETDVAAADWIISRLDGESRPQRVTSIVPDGFDAYARLLHPWIGRDHGTADRRWSKLAEESIEIDATTPHEALDPAAEPQGLQPDAGTLDAESCGNVAGVLTDYTTTPTECWFGYWNGYGRPVPLRSESRRRFGDRCAAFLNRFSLLHRASSAADEVGPCAQIHPGRCYRLTIGRVLDAAAITDRMFDQSPNIWWPADRAWCLVSEIDFHSTYVAGPQTLVDALVATETLEVLQIDPDVEIHC